MKKGLLSIICSLMIMLVIPFSVSANQSLNAPFIGLNVYVWDTEHQTFSRSENYDLDLSNVKLTCQSVNSSGVCSIYATTSQTQAEITGTVTNSNTTDTYYTRQYELILDDNYVGSVTINTKTWYVNGNKLVWHISGAEQTITINNYNLTRVSDPEIYQSFPIESYPFISQFFFNNVSLWNIYGQFDYVFPMFQAQNGDTLFKVFMPKDIEVEFVMILNRSVNNNNLLNTLIPDDSSGISVTLSRNWQSDIILDSNNYNYRPIYFKLNNSETGRTVTFSSGANNLRIMPIYMSRVDFRNMSTDFALKFGLRNEIIDNLNIIAQGTQNSNQTASDVTDTSSDLTDVSTQIHNMESNFNTDLNNNLQAIDTNVSPGTFGSNFLASANWVKTQFDQLTSNTPFGSVLSFSLVLGIGLLIVGRALK